MTSMSVESSSLASSVRLGKRRLREEEGVIAGFAGVAGEEGIDETEVERATWVDFLVFLFDLAMMQNATK